MAIREEHFCAGIATDTSNIILICQHNEMCDTCQNYRKEKHDLEKGISRLETSREYTLLRFNKGKYPAVGARKRSGIEFSHETERVKG